MRQASGGRNGIGAVREFRSHKWQWRGTDKGEWFTERRGNSGRDKSGPYGFTGNELPSRGKSKNDSNSFGGERQKENAHRMVREGLVAWELDGVRTPGRSGVMGWVIPIPMETRHQEDDPVQGPRAF